MKVRYQIIQTTFKELEEMGCASVTDYCRYLMEEGDNHYFDYKIEVYRGEMLCLTVSSVKYGASVEPDPSEGRWRPRRAFKAGEKATG